MTTQDTTGNRVVVQETTTTGTHACSPGGTGTAVTWLGHASVVLDLDGVLLVTADHGNAEQMVDLDTGAPQTAHTTNPVHCILVAKDAAGKKLIHHGKLSDVAPTILNLMGIEVPKEMTAERLIK